MPTGFAGENTGSFPATHADPEATLVTPAAQNEKIGDFEVLGKLSQGGMGAVYHARQISIDCVVARKMLPATLEADEDFVARFPRKARVAASLSPANLVNVYSPGLAAGCHYIAMELIEGETLGLLVKRGPLSPRCDHWVVIQSFSRKLARHAPRSNVAGAFQGYGAWT